MGGVKKVLEGMREVVGEEWNSWRNGIGSGWCLVFKKIELAPHGWQVEKNVASGSNERDEQAAERNFLPECRFSPSWTSHGKAFV